MVHVYKQTQFLPVDIETAWDFFTRPENLNEITPPDLHFKVYTTLPDKVYPGLMIVYKLTLLGFIRFEWVTEIMHVREQVYFVDEQRKGPYSLWHHEHHFKQTDGGVEMTDIVHYKLPFGWPGNLFHGLLVKPQLAKIFDYRKKVLTERFG